MASCGSRACRSSSTTLQKIASHDDGAGLAARSRSTARARRRSPTSRRRSRRTPRASPWTRRPGKVKILDYIACQDVGFAINPAEVDGQIVGGIVQGIGQALYERMAYDETGQITTQSFLDYAIPSAGHAPNIEAIQVEVASDYGSVRREGRRRAAADPVHAGHRQRHQRRYRQPPDRGADAAAGRSSPA